MNSTVQSVSVPADRLAPLRTLRRFVAEALRHCTWKLAAVAALIGLARLGPVFVAQGLSDPTRLLPIGLAVPCVLVAVLLAEQAVRSGVRRLPAYVLAMVAASACVATLWFFIMPLLIYPWTPVGNWPARWSCALFVAADTLGRGGLAAFIYSNREQMLRSMRQLGAAQFEYAEAERALAQTQLQMLQAQIDPESLLGSLRCVHSLYRTRPADAGACWTG
jgi:hypothetical protein